MKTQMHAVKTADGPMELYEARPDQGTGRGLVVIQEAFGVNDHIREVTRRFADQGFHAVAPAIFHRAGGGTAPYGDFAKVMPLFEGLTDEGILMDIDASLAHLREAGLRDAQIGLVGFCFGGRVAFLAAARRAIGAAAGFYGGGIVTARRGGFPPLVGEARSLRTPFLGLFGDRDQGIPVEDVEQLREALRTAPKPAEIVRYPEAEHGFFCNERPSYHEASSKDAWQRTLAFFEAHLPSA
jgi:carboxymethylenebutenolidase